jgi:DNA-binding MarR family transcriptional regulator
MGPSRPQRPITARQAVVLHALITLTARDGITPTLDELGRELGMTAPSVRQHLIALEQKGFIRRFFNKSRGVVVLRARAATRRRPIRVVP